MIELVDIRELAAQMIERLLDDPETGECRVCSAAQSAQGLPHKVDCKAQLIVRGLRKR